MSVGTVMSQSAIPRTITKGATSAPVGIEDRLELLDSISASVICRCFVMLFYYIGMHYINKISSLYNSRAPLFLQHRKYYQ